MQAKAFERYLHLVKLRWDELWLYIESNGLPDHKMMMGITAWQQQVPLPQEYTGANAWKVPRHPVPAKEPKSAKTGFFRGAIAIAVNGVPIFNPIKNDGKTDTFLAGELDMFGGHAGRADDYHYHIAPVFLTGGDPSRPVAFALDGYPIYGYDEPDGSPCRKLDEWNGHDDEKLGYHYHSTREYPYLNGGFRGEVREAGGQVEPQPHDHPIRPATTPLRGATITGFERSDDGKAITLTYEQRGRTGTVRYTQLADGSVHFVFTTPDGTKTEQTYRRDAQNRDNRREETQNPAPPDAVGRQARPAEFDADRDGERASAIGMDAMKKPSASFILTSPEVTNGGKLPVDYTGDGSGATPPLAWKGAPTGTQSFALVMDHLARGNVVKFYWTMWDIPASTTTIPKNVQGVGKVGTSFKGAIGYEPPHSQGPGDKTYVITVYALSAPLQMTQQPREVNRDVLLAAMKDKVLASSSLSVVYASGGSAQGEGQRPPRLDERAGQSPQQGQGQERRPGGGKGGGGRPDDKGLIKPSIADTMKLNVYADNWFVLYVNGRLVAVDPIQFTPHNVVSVDFLPEYPMTIAVMAKDNADPKSGLEYGTNIGDGGFILKFGDGTVTNATWKAKNFSKGPLDRDTANPKVEHTPIPDRWWAVDFDDSKWANATEYAEARIDPKQPYFEADFEGAKFIWTDDLDLDNTIVFRTKIEKPGWKQRWNTKPDLDVTGAPFK